MIDFSEFGNLQRFTWRQHSQSLKKIYIVQLQEQHFLCGDPEVLGADVVQCQVQA